MTIDFRPAEPEESAELTSIVQQTSDGLVDYILTGVIPFTKPHQILNTQVVSGDSLYSYRNMIVCVEDGEIVGLVLAYPWNEQVASDMARRYLPEEKFRVVEALLNSADEDSLFINTLWVAERYRGEGLADALMDVAAEWAAGEGLSRLSLHVWRGNERAVRFYRRHGFVETRTFDFPDHKLLPHKTGMAQLCKELK
jgi:ribosomal protein S18 acetylase RimI-like enzyme